MSLTNQIVIKLLAGKRTHEIAKELKCSQALVSKVRARKGFTKSPNHGLHRKVYFSKEKKYIVKALWFDEDYCATAIAEAVGFPVEKIVEYIQQEGLA